MSISKVKSVQANGTYDHATHGTFYKFEYTMEDGMVINANHKTQDSFKSGDEVEYEVKGSNDYGSYGKVRKPQQQPQRQSGGGGDKVQLYIIRQSSLTRAIEHLSHKDQDSMTKENVVALADYYTNYVLNGI